MPVVQPYPHPARRAGALAALAALAVLGLTACGGTDASDASDASSPSGTPSGSSAGTTASSTEASGLVVEDAWAKAVDSGMSAAFGQIRNTSDAAVTIVSATSGASPRMELHETVTGADGAMTMRPRQGGFEIPAGGTLTLEPGGNHLMLMDVQKALEPGATLPVELTLDDGSTLTLDAVVKEYSGANEKYSGGDMGGMSGDMGGMDHS